MMKGKINQSDSLLLIPPKKMNYEDYESIQNAWY